MAGITKVAVIGAGVMGAGIAAQIANAGVEVLLLDIVPDDADDPSTIAKQALAKLNKAKPAAFMDKRNARLITAGNIRDDMDKLGSCDWVIEAVLENLQVKRDLYANIARHRGANTVVSSNTSTLPLADLTEALPEELKRHFLITHFFNPPRYMRLLEIVSGPDTDPASLERITGFVDQSLGKSPVTCKDTPGFIANRIGTYWLQNAVVKALDRNMNVEVADAVLSRPLGIPKTGVFGLLDMVGLDLMPHILDNLSRTLPASDPFHALGGPPALLEKMIEDGYTGRKGKGGFYRLNAQQEKEVIDLGSGDYSPATRPTPACVKASRKQGPQALFEHDSPEAAYAWSVMVDTLCYALSLVPEIAEDIEAVDRAMRLGYNWKYGPFELVDRIGPSWFRARLEAEKRPLPPLLELAGDRGFYQTDKGRLQYLDTQGEYADIGRPPGVLLLEDVKRAGQPIFSNRSASVWDLGNGVACLEFHSKMNSLNPFIMSLLKKTLKQLPDRGFKGMVIYNEGPNFSVGANIAMLLVGGRLRLWPFIRWVLKDGQETFLQMKQANFPVVGAPAGMALGGGCEILLHCHGITAHAETYMGLVEAGVGIVPGWGGCKEMLARWTRARNVPKGPVYPVMKTFEQIAQAQVSTSAAEARAKQFLRPQDEIVMNRDRVLATACDRVLALAENFRPPEAQTFNLPGPTGKAALLLGVREFANKGLVTRHDSVIAGELANVLSGGNTDMLDELSESQVLRLERDAIVRLMRTAATRDRVAYMLRNGKPLRN